MFFLSTFYLERHSSDCRWKRSPLPSKGPSCKNRGGTLRTSLPQEQASAIPRAGHGEPRLAAGEAGPQIRVSLPLR